MGATGGTQVGPRGGVFHLSATGGRVGGPAPEGKKKKRAVAPANSKDPHHVKFGDAVPGATLSQVRAAFTPPGFTSRVCAVTKSGDHTTLELFLDHPSGKGGSIARTFEKLPGGGVVVHHDLFELSPDLRGQGGAKAVLKSSFDMYEKAGVKRVDTFAVSVGKYTWASMGFRAADQDTRKKVAAAFEQYLAEAGHKTHASIAKHLDLPQIAAYKVGDAHVGKDFLLNHAPAYSATLAIDRGDAYYRLARQKVGG